MAPFFVIFYRKYGQGKGQALMWAFVVQNVALGMYIILKYGIRAGPIAEENWYLFAYLVEKPWMKTGAFAIGVMFADLYMQLLKYRALKTNEERKATYPKMHFLVTTVWFKNVLMLWFTACCIFILLIGHSAIEDPYKWSMPFNACYYTAMHMWWVLSTMPMVFLILTGDFPTLRTMLSRPFCIAAGKLCFVTCLITPLMIQLMYSQQPEGLFLATVGVNELAIGNIFLILFVGMVLYLLFEYPFRRLLQWSVLPSLSWDKIKHAYFVDLFAKIRERMGSLIIDVPRDKKVDNSKDDSLLSPNNINQTLLSGTSEPQSARLL